TALTLHLRLKKISARSPAGTRGTRVCASPDSISFSILVQTSTENVGEAGGQIEREHLANILIHELVDSRNAGARDIDDVERLQRRVGFPLYYIAQPQLHDRRPVAPVAH